MANQRIATLQIGEDATGCYNARFEARFAPWIVLVPGSPDPCVPTTDFDFGVDGSIFQLVSKSMSLITWHDRQLSPVHKPA